MPSVFSLLPRGALRLSLGLSVLALLAGCARISDTAQTLFVSVTPAVATVGTQVVVGKLYVYGDGTGFVALESDAKDASALRCSGRMPVAGFTGRDLDLRCNNGLQSRLALSMRTDLRGFGYGGDGEMAVGLVFGLEPAEVKALLKWPMHWTLGLEEGRYIVTATSSDPGKGMPRPDAAPKPGS